MGNCGSVPEKVVEPKVAKNVPAKAAAPAPASAKASAKASAPAPAPAKAPEPVKKLPPLDSFIPMPFVTLVRPGVDTRSFEGLSDEKQQKRENAAKATAKEVLLACKEKREPSKLDVITCLRDIDWYKSTQYRRDALSAIFYVTKMFGKTDLSTELVVCGALEQLLDIAANSDDHKVAYWALLSLVNLVCIDSAPVHDRVRLALANSGISFILRCLETSLGKKEDPLDAKMGVYQQGTLLIASLCSIDKIEAYIPARMAGRLINTLKAIDKEAGEKDYSAFVGQLIASLEATTANMPDVEAHPGYKTSRADADSWLDKLAGRLEKGDDVSIAEVKDLAGALFKHRSSAATVMKALKIIQSMSSGPSTKKLKPLLLQTGVTFAMKAVLSEESSSEVVHCCLDIFNLLSKDDASTCLTILSSENGELVQDAQSICSTKNFWNYLKTFHGTDESTFLPVFNLLKSFLTSLQVNQIYNASTVEGMRTAIYLAMKAVPNSQKLRTIGVELIASLLSQYEVYGWEPWVYTKDGLAGKITKDQAAHEEVVAKRKALKAEEEAKKAKKAKKAEEKKAKKEQQEDQEEEEDTFDNAPPKPAAWLVKKGARKGGVFNRGVQERWLVLLDGHLRYYDPADKIEGYPFVKEGAIHKNELSNGIQGCKAMKWHESPSSGPVENGAPRRASSVGGDDAFTIEVTNPDDANPLVCGFKNELEAARFLILFADHVKFYSKK
jgi:hypothetical protein